MEGTLFDQAKACHTAGELDRAAELYRAAAAADAADFKSRHNLGAVLEAQGALAEAEAAYRDALAANPGAAWTHYNLARLRHLAGDLDAAETGYRRSLELDPGLAEAHFNLGRLLAERGAPAGAEAALRESLRLAGETVQGQVLLGDSLLAQRRVRDALAAYRRAVEIAPDEAVAHYDVGKALEFLDRLDEAVECYRRCVALEPLSVAAREGLARALHAAGRRDEALAELKEWRSLAPGEPVAAHLLASFGAEPEPERASDAYVRATFDRFAGDFDATLERLGYRAPQLLVAALALACGEPAGALEVLDAGCGTGICAPLLRPWARRLEGVDLSGAMLEKARRRGGYDALHEAELTRFLGDKVSCWDVIVSADTLCYFGELAPVLKAAARALRAGGVIAFTVERLEGAEGAPGADHALQAHGRYAHAEGYVARVLDACGFEAAIAHGDLRHEGGRPVAGLVVVGRRR